MRCCYSNQSQPCVLIKIHFVENSILFFKMACLLIFYDFMLPWQKMIIFFECDPKHVQGHKRAWEATSQNFCFRKGLGLAVSVACSCACRHNMRDCILHRHPALTCRRRGFPLHDSVVCVRRLQWTGITCCRLCRMQTM